MTQAYPLQWPEGFPRTKAANREGGKFKTGYDNALRNVVSSLRLFMQDSGREITGSVLSSNMDMLNRYPDDPGVAVWFVWDGMQVCIPVDRYSTPAANLQAIYHIIEARRVELRHGTLALVRATFTGFKALPPPKGEHWSELLNVPRNAPKNVIEEAFRAKAHEHHPDKGGSDAMMAKLTAARKAALNEIGA